MLKSVRDCVEGTLVLYKRGEENEKFIIMVISNVYGTILDI